MERKELQLQPLKLLLILWTIFKYRSLQYRLHSLSIIRKENWQENPKGNKSLKAFIYYDLHYCDFFLLAVTYLEPFSLLNLLTWERKDSHWVLEVWGEL